MIETIIMYKTEDGRIFSNYEEANSHQKNIPVSAKKNRLKHLVINQINAKRTLRKTKWENVDSDTQRYLQQKILYNTDLIRRIQNEIKKEISEYIKNKMNV